MSIVKLDTSGTPETGESSGSGGLILGLFLAAAAALAIYFATREEKKEPEQEKKA